MTSRSNQTSIKIGTGVYWQAGFYFTMGVICAIALVLLLLKVIDFVFTYIGGLL